MDTAVKAGLAVAVLGLLLILAGWWIYAHPSAVTKTITVEKDQKILDASFTVNNMAYRYLKFDVPPNADEPLLSVSIKSDGDIRLIVLTSAGEAVYRELINGYAERYIKLPGPGGYEIRFDNTFSLLTPKHVTAEAWLHYKQPVVKTEEEVSMLAPEMLILGSALIIGGLLAAALSRLIDLYLKRKTG